MLTLLGGLVVHSFSGDDPIRCKDYVREKVGISTDSSRVIKHKMAAVYDYRDDNGELLYQVVRLVPKSFRQRRPDGVWDYSDRLTIRAEGSEIWFSWNPRRKVDAIDQFMRQDTPSNSIVVKANWSDNPFFPDVLDEERRLDFERYPERYAHVWEGDYARAFEGAYFAKQLADARAEGRIGKVAADLVLPTRLYWDIGFSDATAISAVQFVGQAINVLDYIEGSGQPLGYYTNELRARGYDRAKCILPHDGVAGNAVTGLRYQDHLKDAGFDVEVIKNQGKGAAMQRIEAVRRIFPKVWFNEEKCQAGIDCLGYYHERRDDARDTGLGPEHDFS
jgi:phage terminase large subunit